MTHQPRLKIIRQKLTVPPSIYSHPNYLEAQAVVLALNLEMSNSSKVAGTANTQKLELYGWRNPVQPHIDTFDSSRFIYFTILDNNDTTIGLNERYAESCTIIKPKIGDIVRMDDSQYHWTDGLGSCVAMFCGTFKRSCDAEVAKHMQFGINRLANNMRAPKIPQHYSKSFFNGECLVAGKYEAELSTFKIAERKQQEIITCKYCKQPAVIIDHLYPYGDEHRCADHRKIP